ncbi:MAG: glycosyltransferase family 2 protein [Armatimonadetes bacterium]|nr:glycosyltransferase family 2 protein [Armatimonadota bacterium]
MPTEPHFVTVIIPERNEEQYIERCLRSVLEQTYPLDRLEILVVDGMSADSTRSIVESLARSHQNIRLLDNPQRIVPTAMNIGLREAKGDIIIRVDGHCFLRPDYIEQCMDALERTGAECVGGSIETIGETIPARGIAAAMRSPFGVGNAAFRYATEERYVDTLAFGAYRREVFERIGLFDEELVRDQDDEMNFRLIQSGGKIFLTPKIQASYFSRSSLKSLWSQYYQYGYWKVRVIQKRGRPASWRHLIPATFVVALVISFLLMVAGFSLGKWFFLAVTTPYLAANLALSLKLAQENGWGCFPYIALAFAILHLSYGVGFWHGLLRFAIFPKRPHI